MQGNPQKIDEGISFFRETIVNNAKKDQGFNEAYMFVNRQTGKIFATVFWENQQSIEASNALASRVIPEMAHIMGAQSQQVDIWEVAVAQVPTPVGTK